MSEPTREHEHGFTCVEVVELATEFVDGAMTPQQATQFELHLNFCDGCDSFLDQIRQTSKLVGKVGEEAVPSELKDSLLTAFRDWGRS